MKKTEIGVVIIALISVVLGFLNVPYTHVVKVLSIGVLAMLYYPFGFLLLNGISIGSVFKKESYKGKSALRIIGSAIAGVIYSIGVIGFLFKIQFYPGASVILYAGSIGLLLVLITSTLKFMKGKDLFYLRMIKRTLVIGFVVLVVGVVPYETLVGWRYPNASEYSEALINSLENPGNMELMEIEQREREAYYQKRD